MQLTIEDNVVPGLKVSLPHYVGLMDQYKVMSWRYYDKGIRGSFGEAIWVSEDFDVERDLEDFLNNTLYPSAYKCYKRTRTWWYRLYHFVKIRTYKLRRFIYANTHKKTNMDY